MDYKKYLQNFLNEEGKLKELPAKRKLKIVFLFYLSTKFEYDKEYTEKEVNEIIDNECMFKDAALLRRELYMYRFIDRKKDCSLYWKEKEQPKPEKYGL